MLDGNQHGAKINLKGLAVGDPCTDNDAQSNSLDVLWYSHKYGLVSPADFELLWSKCGVRFPSLGAAGAWHMSKGRMMSARRAHHVSKGRRVEEAPAGQLHTRAHDVATAPSLTEASYRPSHSFSVAPRRPKSSGAHPSAAAATAAVAALATAGTKQRLSVEAGAGDAEAAGATPSAEERRHGASPAECKAAVRRFLVTSSQALAQDYRLGFINDYSL